MTQTDDLYAGNASLEFIAQLSHESKLIVVMCQRIDALLNRVQTLEDKIAVMEEANVNLYASAL